MTQNSVNPLTDEVAQVAVSKRSGPSIVWLIPLVAVTIGGWLAYKTISEKGPAITITFKTAAGLEAGKTKLKYKAVEVGKIDTVTISGDLSHVKVTATLDKEASRHLNEGTRFWVVRPRFGAEGISGLGTIVSGAYIEVEPGEGAPKLAFEGLEQPPVVKADTPGHKYVLRAKHLGSLGAGAPVYFRQIRVGEVLGHELADDERSVLIHVFVNSPHHQLVRENTRFWNASGIDVSMGADGLNVKTQSLIALLSGGVAFETEGKPGKPGEDGATFELYDTRDGAEQPSYSEKIQYVLYFDGSVRGLTIGAPVEFRGMQVGEVTDVRIEFDSKHQEVLIPVTVALEPKRVPSVDGVKAADADTGTVIDGLVRHGLRAQLQTGSLLTGQRFVELDLHPDKPATLANVESEHPQLPTIPSSLDAITQSATQILANIGELPLDKLFNELIGTVQGVNAIVHSPELMDTVHSADATLKAFRKLARNANGKLGPLTASIEGTTGAATGTLHRLGEALSMLADGSPLRIDLLNTLEETAGAARSLRVLADYLERNPDALVYGKAGARK